MDFKIFQSIKSFLNELSNAVLMDQYQFAEKFRSKKIILPDVSSYQEMLDVLRQLWLADENHSLFTYKVVYFLLRQKHPESAMQLLLAMNAKGFPVESVIIHGDFECNESGLERLKLAINLMHGGELLSANNIRLFLKHATPELFFLAYDGLKKIHYLTPRLFSYISYASELSDDLEYLFNGGILQLAEHDLATDENIEYALSHRAPEEFISSLIFLKQSTQLELVDKYKKSLFYAIKPQQFAEGVLLLITKGVHDPNAVAMMCENSNPFDVAEAFVYLINADILDPAALNFLKSRQSMNPSGSLLQAVMAYDRLSAEGVLNAGVLYVLKKHPNPAGLSAVLTSVFDQSKRVNNLWNDTIIKFLLALPDRNGFYDHLPELGSLAVELFNHRQYIDLERVLNNIKNHSNPLSAAKAYVLLTTSSLSRDGKALLASRITKYYDPCDLAEALLVADGAGFDTALLGSLVTIAGKALSTAQIYVAYKAKGIDLSLPLIKDLLSISRDPLILIDVIDVLLDIPDIHQKYSDIKYSLKRIWENNHEQQLIDILNLFVMTQNVSLLNFDVIEKIVSHADFTSTSLYEVIGLLYDYDALNKNTLRSLLAKDKFDGFKAMLSLPGLALKKADVVQLTKKRNNNLCLVYSVLSDFSKLGIPANYYAYSVVIGMSVNALDELKALVDCLLECGQVEFSQKIIKWALANPEKLHSIAEFVFNVDLSVFTNDSANISFDDIVNHPFPGAFYTASTMLKEKGMYNAQWLDACKDINVLSQVLKCIGSRHIDIEQLENLLNAEKPLQVAEAWNILCDQMLLSKNILHIVLTHSNPISAVQAIVYLNRSAQSHSLLDDACIINHAYPYEFCLLIDRLAGFDLLRENICLFLYHYQDKFSGDLQYIFDYILQFSKLPFINDDFYRALANAALEEEHLKSLSKMLSVFPDVFTQDRLVDLLSPRCRWLLTEEAYQDLWARLPVVLTDEQTQRLLDGVRRNGNNLNQLFNFIVNGRHQGQRNDNQSTHTASIHLSTSQSATRLQARYSIGNNDIKLLHANLLKLMSNHAYQDQDMSDPDNNLYVLKREAAVRALTRLGGPNGNFADAGSQISLNVLVALIAKAIQDDTSRVNTLKNALDLMIDAFYEIQRGYNSSDTKDFIGGDPDHPICLSGTFNKLIEKMVGIHPDCELIYLTKQGASLALPAIIKDAVVSCLANWQQQCHSEAEQSEFNALLDQISQQGYGVIVEDIQVAVIQTFGETYQAVYRDKAEMEGEVVIGIQYTGVDEDALRALYFISNKPAPLAPVSLGGMFAPPLSPSQGVSMENDEDQSYMDEPVAKRPKMYDQ